MIPLFDPEIQDLLEIVLKATPAGKNIYLVGGAVRDLLLDQQIKDLDFVCEGETYRLSQAVKRALHAQAFILDDERQTARVIHDLKDGNKILLDFVTFTGKDLGQDLQNRDFTINAMAMNLHALHQLIDPMSGKVDLENHMIRVCSPNSIHDDPLRVMRGVRLVLSYGLEIEPQTLILMREASSDLAQASAERKRDELFKILGLDEPDKAIRLLDDLNCLPGVLPELTLLKQVPASPPHIHTLWEHTLHVVKYLNIILYAIDKDQSWRDLPAFESMTAHLWRFQPELKEHLAVSHLEGRPRSRMALLGALYHDTGKPPETMTEGTDRRLHYYGHADESTLAIEQRASGLCLSNQEVSWLAGIARNHMRVHHLAGKGELPSARTIYRYFRDTEESGIDICLLSLADTLATYEDTLNQDQWLNEIKVVECLFEAWWHQREEVIQPPKLFDGNDLQQICDLIPGPIFAEVLEALREAQVIKQVQTREEAEAFVTSFLNKTRID